MSVNLISNCPAYPRVFAILVAGAAFFEPQRRYVPGKDGIERGRDRFFPLLEKAAVFLSGVEYDLVFHVCRRSKFDEASPEIITCFWRAGDVSP